MHSPVNLHPFKLDAGQRVRAKVLFQDLFTDERFYHVEPRDAQGGAFYFSAKLLNHQDYAFIPIGHNEEYDFERIVSLQKDLPECTLYMAIVDNQCQILYYNVSEGLKEKLAEQKEKMNKKKK